MLTNVLFGQPSVSAADPLSVKATEGPARQQGNRSFSDHVDDRPRKYETNSTSQKEPHSESRDRADAARDDRTSPKATASNADRTERKSAQSSDVAEKETTATKAEDASGADPVETGASVDGVDAEKSDEPQNVTEGADELTATAAPTSNPDPAKVRIDTEIGVVAPHISGEAAKAGNLNDEGAAKEGAAAIAAKGGDSLPDAVVGPEGRQPQLGNGATVEVKAAEASALGSKDNMAEPSDVAAAANVTPEAEGAEVELASKALDDATSVLRGNGAAQVQMADAAARRSGEKVVASGPAAAGSAAASDMFENALSEVSQTGEADIDVAAVTRESAGKAGATAEGAASFAASTAAEPGRRAQGRTRESLDVQATTPSTAETQSTNKTAATQQVSAVQQAFVAQAMEADVSTVGARGDQAPVSGEMNVDSRGLSQILTEAALQPGTVHRPETPRQIGVQLASAFMAKGDRNVDVALNPEELGRVKMRVSTSETGITMVIQTERPETGDLMRRHINELAEEFRKMGFDNISFEFSGEGAAAGGGMGDSEASAGGGQSGLGAEGEDLEMAEAAEIAMKQLNLGNAGVDMRL